MILNIYLGKKLHTSHCLLTKYMMVHSHDNSIIYAVNCHVQRIYAQIVTNDRKRCMFIVFFEWNIILILEEVHWLPSLLNMHQFYSPVANILFLALTWGSNSICEIMKCRCMNYCNCPDIKIRKPHRIKHWNWYLNNYSKQSRV